MTSVRKYLRFSLLLLKILKGSRIKEELNMMLKSGIKAEIEALAPTAAALCDAYLPAKLIHSDYLG